MGLPGTRPRHPGSGFLDNRNKKMSTLTKWNPAGEIEALQRRMGSFFGRPLLHPARDDFFAAGEWTLPVDVSENDKEFVITAELPEVKKEDLKITLEDGALKIAGERKLEKEEKGVKYHRIERSYGVFERSFVLPEGTKPGEVKAEFHDGLLKVHLPKNKETRPKALEIAVK